MKCPNQLYPLYEKADYSWEDYALSISTLNIGHSIATGEESIWDLGDLIYNSFLKYETGRNGVVDILTDRFGTLEIEK